MEHLYLSPEQCLKILHSRTKSKVAKIVAEWLMKNVAHNTPYLRFGMYWIGSLLPPRTLLKISSILYYPDPQSYLRTLRCFKFFPRGVWLLSNKKMNFSVPLTPGAYPRNYCWTIGGISHDSVENRPARISQDPRVYTFLRIFWIELCQSYTLR